MMSQFPALERLRPLLRLEYAVLAALLVVAAVWYSFDSRVEDARDAEIAAEQKVKAAREDLNLFVANNEQAELEERLRVLQLEQKTLELAPMVDALRVRDDILNYVEERQLVLNAFGKAETTTTLGDQEVLALRYNFTVQGDEESLIGILSLLKEHPTASVQSLQFARKLEAVETWVMGLELSVFFLDSEQDQGT